MLSNSYPLLCCQTPQINQTNNFDPPYVIVKNLYIIENFSTNLFKIYPDF